MKLKRLHQNRAFSLQCSSYGCESPACTYIATGIVDSQPKMAGMTQANRLFAVACKGDNCHPMCKRHAKLFKQFIKAIRY